MQVNDRIELEDWNKKVTPVLDNFYRYPQKVLDKLLKLIDKDKPKKNPYRKSNNLKNIVYTDSGYENYSDKKEKFVGPRFMIRLASLEMHPLDQEDRIPKIKNEFGSGMCNITRCCTDVCPEHIQITDNGIIPLKERVVDRFYDPVMWIYNKLFGNGAKQE